MGFQLSLTNFGPLVSFGGGPGGGGGGGGGVVVVSFKFLTANEYIVYDVLINLFKILGYTFELNFMIWNIFFIYLPSILRRLIKSSSLDILIFFISIDFNYQNVHKM